ncbi:MAG: phenylalanine--tRNA ligase subunit alpha, partial [Clostridia bacterium]|nr:phenylalanine--tRNA ligase subunit alpha [Clostridia bacterium]
MQEQLTAIREAAAAALNEADTLARLEELRIQYLGKKGELTAVMKGMGKLSPEERPVVGQLAN